MAQRRTQGKLKPMTQAQKDQRQAKRNRKKTWAVRVWSRKHIRGD